MTVATEAQRPAFIITIDAEGDNLWSAPRVVTTRNAPYMPRFQSLCEQHGLKPTWLTNYEMANCREFGEFADDMLIRDAGEVGMHLHAWDSPPVTDGDPAGQAYLIEYPTSRMREKIARMTDCLESRFGTKMLSHRAGRWAFNSTYARLLVEFGYNCDCSVTPHVNWTQYLGDPEGAGGTDYRAFPSQPYFVDLDNIDQPGDSPLLEVPMSIVRSASNPSWLRPDGRNLDDMLGILRHAVEIESPCVVFMLHSSELMPGGSPAFPSSRAIDSLYGDLESLFSLARDAFRGMTLTQFRRNFWRTNPPGLC